jgi:hypothetical protein
MKLTDSGPLRRFDSVGRLSGTDLFDSMNGSFMAVKYTNRMSQIGRQPKLILHPAKPSGEIRQICRRQLCGVIVAGGTRPLAVVAQCTFVTVKQPSKSIVIRQLEIMSARERSGAVRVRCVPACERGGTACQHTRPRPRNDSLSSIEDCHTDAAMTKL